MEERTRLRYCLLLLFLTLATESSSDSFSNVTRSWQNDRKTATTTSGSTNTFVTAADYYSSFEDDNATTALLKTSAPNLFSFWQIHEMMKWFKIGSPILIVLATVGNTVALITLQNPTLHHEFHI